MVDKAFLEEAELKKALEEAKVTGAVAKKAVAAAEDAAKQEELDQKVAAQKALEASNIKAKEEAAVIDALQKQVRYDKRMSINTKKHNLTQYCHVPLPV